MKICYIFAGAEIENYDKIAIEKNLYIICADGGYLHAKHLGIIPNVVLGDFDTIDCQIDSRCEVIKYPAEKDDTDSMLAIKLALKKGFDQIEIYGAVGGRLDHTFANIQAFAYIKQNGANATIYGDNEEIKLIQNEKITIKKHHDYYLSIFSFSEKCEGITEIGVKYPLNNAVITNYFPLGVSNEIIEENAEIEVVSGTLLIILSKKN
ncbi:MAG: thiamine diphosphokinase [Oscillospiraceae bacterium]